ncbi:hypothetical protein [Acinetobacter junii]|uniref:hypothetical protein n=1 Tax=Acinetobacter junii TaxID=40215 RepID=UPI002860718D|nr:hypothetical protein [Acinetobacter junii]MDR7655479.1 hypothetical protein [Acinetobacter junii]
MESPEKCPNCGNFFTVKEHLLSMPGTKEKEIIRCPYDGCNYYREEISNGWFNTYKSNPPKDLE